MSHHESHRRVRVDLMITPGGATARVISDPEAIADLEERSFFSDLGIIIELFNTLTIERPQKSSPPRKGPLRGGPFHQRYTNAHIETRKARLAKGLIHAKKGVSS